jgi:hypothetical protein
MSHMLSELVFPPEWATAQRAIHRCLVVYSQVSLQFVLTTKRFAALGKSACQSARHLISQVASFQADGSLP